MGIIIIIIIIIMRNGIGMIFLLSFDIWLFSWDRINNIFLCVYCFKMTWIHSKIIL
jgi:hypothetical protein